jgi:hypothetical protein
VALFWLYTLKTVGIMPVKNLNTADPLYPAPFNLSAIILAVKVKK